MDQIEQVVVQACMRDRELHAKLGFKDYSAIADILSISEVSRRDIMNWLYGKPLSGNKAQEIAINSIVNVIQCNSQEVLNHYNSINPSAAIFLSSILQKYATAQVAGVLSLPTVRSPGIVSTIFRNWSAPPRRGHGSLQTGLYQTFRRHKPTITQKTRPDPQYDWNITDNHAIVCELLYVDLEGMECRMVTGDLNVYFGTLCITHEDILYALLQRPSDTTGEVHQRFLASKIERPGFEMYSGLMMKIGNISIRPIASEFFYIPIDRLRHKELFESFGEVRLMNWHSPYPIEENSVIAEYVSVTPPRTSRRHPDWSRARYIRDFPILSKLSKEMSPNVRLFREPLRTLSAETLSDVLNQGQLEVFRQERTRHD